MRQATSTSPSSLFYYFFFFSPLFYYTSIVISINIFFNSGFCINIPANIAILEFLFDFKNRYYKVIKLATNTFSYII